jgi:hypothetical protein
MKNYLEHYLFYNFWFGRTCLLNSKSSITFYYCASCCAFCLEVLIPLASSLRPLLLQRGQPDPTKRHLSKTTVNKNFCFLFCLLTRLHSLGLVVGATHVESKKIVNFDLVKKIINTVLRLLAERSKVERRIGANHHLLHIKTVVHALLFVCVV